MGLLDWFTGKKKSLPIARVDGTGDFRLEIVGESHYQKALEKITGGKTPDGHEMELDALLIHDDGNPYDNKAVAVTIGGDIVGYLDKKLARQFRERMEEAGFPYHPAVCKALIVGGWDRGNGDEGYFGVKLDMPVE